MNETERKIEIFKPFGEAFELMTKILFQPFGLKWLVIGFAAFLTGHFSGVGFNFPTNFGNFRHPHTAQKINLFEQWKPWLPVIIIGIVIFVLALVIVLMWLKSRGSFIFTDCIVRNRGAIAEPWREYRTEGNSYFVFQLLVMLGAMAAVVLLAIVFVLLGFLASGHREPSGVVMAALLVPLFICWIAFGIVINLIFLFMAPVMYRQRCPAPDAARQVLRLIFANPAPFILFCLRNCAHSGDARYRLRRDVRHVLHRRIALLGNGNLAASFCYSSFFLASVSAAVWSGIRYVDEFHATGVFSCFIATACAAGVTFASVFVT